MKTISFIGNSEPPDRLLNLFRKFTPNNSGIWGQLKGEPHYNTDYYAVIDYLPSNLVGKIDESKIVYLGAHPPTMQAYRSFKGVKCLKSYDVAIEPGFLEYWLKYSYDELISMSPPVKTKELCCIISDADTQPYHKARKAHLERFCAKYPSRIDVYGRIKPYGAIVGCYRGACGSFDPRGAQAGGGNDHMSGKEILKEYKHCIEYDAEEGVGGAYFSERICDDLLMYCSPIYWGCKRLSEFLPHQCFSFLDINKNGEDIIDIIDSNLWDSKLSYIIEARDKILHKWLIWSRVHEAIFLCPK